MMSWSGLVRVVHVANYSFQTHCGLLQMHVLLFYNAKCGRIDPALTYMIQEYVLCEPEIIFQNSKLG